MINFSLCNQPPTPHVKNEKNIELAIVVVAVCDNSTYMCSYWPTDSFVVFEE